MRIVCPSCQATYDVPDATLGAAPRKVRCAKCDMVWGVDPAPEPAMTANEHDDAHLPPPVAITPRLAEPIPEPAPIAASHRLPTTHKSSRSAIAPAIAWLVSIAVLVAAAWTVIVWRVPIMQFWAPSQRLYRWLGLG
jgi:predicted Zn finger-like uncharacterized protein